MHSRHWLIIWIKTFKKTLDERQSFGTIMFSQSIVKITIQATFNHVPSMFFHVESKCCLSHSNVLIDVLTQNIDQMPAVMVGHEAGDTHPLQTQITMTKSTSC